MDEKLLLRPKLAFIIEVLRGLENTDQRAEKGGDNKEEAEHDEQED